MKRRKITIYAA